MTLLGKDQVDAALDKAVQSFQQRLGGAMYVVANNVMTDAKRITPHDTGTLMASGYVALPQPVGTGVSVELGFGGFAKDYAVIQHEDTSLTHDPGRQAWYLEEPIAKERPRLVHDIASALKIGATVTGANPSNPDAGGKKPKVKRTAKQKAAAARKSARKVKVKIKTKRGRRAR